MIKGREIPEHMNILEFMSDSPFLSFFIVLILAQFILFLIQIPFKHMNIRKHGYPPEHCDADGDLKKDSKDD